MSSVPSTARFQAVTKCANVLTDDVEAAREEAKQYHQGQNAQLLLNMVLSKKDILLDTRLSEEQRKELLADLEFVKVLDPAFHSPRLLDITAPRTRAPPP